MAVFASSGELGSVLDFGRVLAAPLLEGSECRFSVAGPLVRESYTLMRRFCLSLIKPTPCLEDPVWYGLNLLKFNRLVIVMLDVLCLFFHDQVLLRILAGKLSPSILSPLLSCQITVMVH